MTGPSMRPVILSVLVALAAVSPCIGQQPPDLTALAVSQTISDSQSEQIGQWTEAWVRTVRTGQEDALSRARSDLLGLLGQAATPAFRAALARQLARRTDGLMSGFNARQSRLVVSALAAAQAPTAIDALLKALSNADPATRLLAARGIAAFKGDLADATDRVLERLGQVALAEPVPLVKAELCRALGLPARTETVVPLLGEIVTSHTDRFRREGPADVSPMLAAVETLGGLRLAGLAPKDRPRVVHALANLLHYAVVIYTGGADLQTELKQDLERIIYRTEAVLAGLVAGEGATEMPKVTEAMMAGGDQVHDNMRAELNKWLGGAGGPGLLNAAPWSLPNGGGFAEIGQLE